MASATLTNRYATGPASVAAAEQVRRQIQRRDTWPYVHCYPPPNSIRRDPVGYVVCPNPAVQVEILNSSTGGALFVVPSGYLFFLVQVGLYVGANNSGWNPGDFLFTLDKNVPLGASTYQGVPLTDWQSIPFTYGSLTNGPVTLPRAELFQPTDSIRAKVTNVNLGAGAPNFFLAQLGGYLVPTLDAPDAD